MKKSRISAALSCALSGTATVLLTSVSQPTLASGPDAKPPAPAKVARGKYLVNTSGCHDCHTPWKPGPNGPEPDMSLALSGHPASMQLPPAPKPEGPWIVSIAATNTAIQGPWGRSYSANLTPDQETGLGKWTLRNFRDTIRTGKRMGRGRDVLPPMPIMVYNNFTDDDLEAIYSYLRTIPAISNKVPEPLTPDGATVAAR